MPTKAPAAAARAAICSPGFLRRGRLEVERQAGGHDMPEFAHLGVRRVKFGADDRGEAVGAHGARIGDRPIVIADEMVRQHHEVVAGVLVGVDHLLGCKRAVGQGRMGVEIAAPEAAGKREGREVGHGGLGGKGSA